MGIRTFKTAVDGALCRSLWSYRFMAESDWVRHVPTEPPLRQGNGLWSAIL